MAQTVQTIQFPYKRSLGPVLGAFMTALTDRRIIGIRSGDRVIVPPLEWDPDTAEELAHDFVDVGPAGTVETWSLGRDPDGAASARPPVRVRARSGSTAPTPRSCTRWTPARSTP